MKKRFGKTRKKLHIQMKGGDLFKSNTFEIFDINEKITRDNMFGLNLVLRIVSADARKAGEQRNDISLLQPQNLIPNGNFFNNSVAYHNYRGIPFLLGVGRLNTRQGISDGFGSRNPRTGTTIQNRDALSGCSNWCRGWGEPDIPLFFVIRLDTKDTKFFFMQYDVFDLAENRTQTDFLLEDPRILIDGDTVLFYAHRNTGLTQPGSYDRIGSNLHATFNKGAKVAFRAGAPQYLYVSWCYLREIESVLDFHFFAGANPINIIPSRIWKPLCTNLLNTSPEKNWALVAKTDEDGNRFYDFISSIGGYTTSLVYYRYDRPKLLSDIDMGGGVLSTECEYIETRGGLTKKPGEAIVQKPYYQVNDNNKITQLDDKIKIWLNQLLLGFFEHIWPSLRQDAGAPVPDRADLPDRISLPKAKLTLEKKLKPGGARIYCTYPVKDDLGNFRRLIEHPDDMRHDLGISVEQLRRNQVKFLRGISSGGPGCKILGSRDDKEMVFVGHFKCMHMYVYPAIVAALAYKTDSISYVVPPADAPIVQAGFRGAISQKFSDLERPFVSFLTDEVNIFRYTYSIIHKTEPYNPHVSIPALNAVPNSYKNLPVIHNDQMYSSYLFKMHIDKFQITGISSQIYFDNSPKDCKGPVLQFSSTIASNGVDTYYIPYGDNDVVGRVAILNRQDFDRIVFKSMLGSNREPDNYNYVELAKVFLALHTFKKSPAPAPAPAP